MSNSESGTGAPSRAPIDIGLIIVGRLSQVDSKAVKQAREQLSAWLENQFPQFSWRIHSVQREGDPQTISREPSALLRDGSDLRAAEGWDFAILFTAADLASRYKPNSLAATSSALDLAIISTNRVDPHTFDSDMDDQERAQILGERLAKLCIRSLGHLCGLATTTDEHNVMHTPSSPGALRAMNKFEEAQHQAMESTLSQIADPRLEETQAANLSPRRFYLNSARINWHEISSAVLHARPWEFPLRLLRLTAAALSATTLLMLTAETWHLASEQSITKLAILLTVVLTITTALVADRQRLLVQRTTGKISEQTVITNLSAVFIVLIGLATTALALLSINLLAGHILYTPSLVASWINSGAGSVTTYEYWQAALLVTTLGLFIGALGATFEEQHHFRHVVFVDEEI